MDRTGKLAVHRTTLSDNAFGPCEPRWLVIDAKYKDPLRGTWGKQYFHNEDLYQAFTNAAALDAPAVLVYPRVDQDVDVTLEIARHDINVGAVPLAISVCPKLWARRLERLLTKQRAPAAVDRHTPSRGKPA